MNVKKYQAGGIGPKNKAAAKPLAKTRAQEVEESKMVAARRAEDLKIAENIKKDVRSEVGPGVGRPSTNKGNVTLSTAKTQAISKSGDRKPDAQKYTRGQLEAQFSGRGQQPVYLKGETLGYGEGREISRGPGFTANASMPTRNVQRSAAPTAAKKSPISAEMQRRIEAGKGKSAAIGKAAGEYTLEEARRLGLKLKGGGMIPRIKK